MDRILSKVWNSCYGKYLLPLCFCVENLINVACYYLGLAFQDNIARQAAFIIGNVLFTLIAFSALLSALRFGQMKLRSLLPLGAVLLHFPHFALAFTPQQSGRNLRSSTPWNTLDFLQPLRP